ncbi:SLAM family member 5-like, partial [Sphaerodactylus townsendi]|uniref:SLAM family member 5-like n=1 Tax=Sphaerodactylus townsendi TaxID=933632 RepID=UPI00202667A6
SVGEQMTGTLGGSVTFHLKRLQKKSTQISWFKTVEKQTVIIADVDVGLTCRTSVLRFEFVQRLVVSEDCKSLQISPLYQNDSGRYIGQIGEYYETFSLKVYKNLAENDLDIQCGNDGNDVLQLNCSAGRWEDGVNYSWTSQSENGKSSPQTVQIQGDDMNYTCTAENPVSKASKTVSVQQACEGITVGSPSHLLIGATVAALIVVKVIAIVLAVALASRKKRPQRR